MRIGTVVPMAEGDSHEGTPDWDEIRRFAERAELAGVDYLWVFDHMYSNVPGTEPRGQHEAWSLLTALAVATEKVELGQLTARYADAWNTAWFWEPNQKLHDRLAAFDTALGQEGREVTSVRRTVGIEVQEADQPSAAKRLADLFATYSGLPVDDLILVLQPMNVQSLDRLGEAIRTASTA
jgi:alkanesulfonate monooxygenase SsuD/methylene tetrahydromethanopterin reductase-like flavin-dependent oxidoreductase (luciferase family)